MDDGWMDGWEVRFKGEHSQALAGNCKLFVLKMA